MFCKIKVEPKVIFNLFLICLKIIFMSITLFLIIIYVYTIILSNSSQKTIKNWKHPIFCFLIIENRKKKVFDYQTCF